MEEKQVENEKDLKETFRDFLFNLNAFLDRNSIIQNANVEVLFIQEPIEILGNEFYARGLVKIGEFAYPFEVDFDTDLGVIKVDSDVFQFRVHFPKGGEA
jgi:hypothetical protein